MCCTMANKFKLGDKIIRKTLLERLLYTGVEAPVETVHAVTQTVQLDTDTEVYLYSVRNVAISRPTTVTNLAESSMIHHADAPSWLMDKANLITQRALLTLREKK